MAYVPDDVHFADDFQPDFGLDWVPPPSIERAYAMTDDELREMVEAREDVKRRAEMDPVEWGWRMPSWKRVQENWKKYKIHVILGGNRCLAPEVPLWVEEKKAWIPISQIGGEFTTLSWDGKKTVLAKSSAPFIKGRQQMLSVRLTNGTRFRCTPAHRVLCTDGKWRRIGSMGRKHHLLLPGGADWGGIIGDRYWDLEDDVWDVSVDGTKCYVTAGAVHHNSSKSSFASRLMMWGARTIPEFEGRCWHVNEDRSIEDQQRFMWEALPYQYKNLSRKKGPNYSVQYTQKNGFTGNVLILPPSVQGAQRGGTIKFNNYRQYQQDAQIAEGFKSHIIWMDEEAPQKLFETMLPRLIDYHGRLVLTFTTLQGWTPLIADILGKVRVLEKRYATLLGEPIPYVMESESRNGSVVWCFWTEDNPFVDGNELANVLKGRPRSEIKARAYGLPDRGTEAKFPKFQRDVNVVPHAEVPFIKNPKQHVTRYVSLDPAGSKSWFMIWAALDALGRIWIYREWPDVGFGDWVEPSSKLEGKPGPAQKNPGYGINDYVEMIKEAEKGEVVLDRFIDPRMGAAITQGEDGAETIISKLDDAGLVFQPAPGKDIADGEALINDVLAWDESKKRDSTNSPRLFISDACGNLIHAMENYMGIGQDEPCKDPIDCLRYLLQSAPDYVAPGGVVGKRRGGY